MNATTEERFDFPFGFDARVGDDWVCPACQEDRYDHIRFDGRKGLGTCCSCSTVYCESGIVEQEVEDEDEED